MLLRRAHRIWLGLALALLALASVYAWRGPAVVGEAQRLAQDLWKQASRPPPPSAEETRAARSGSGSAGGTGSKAAPSAQLRKCVQGERVTYTNEPCPAGSREELVQGELSIVR